MTEKRLFGMAATQFCGRLRLRLTANTVEGEYSRQTADHGTHDAQDGDVALVDLRRYLCGIWINRLPQRYWRRGATSNAAFYRGGLFPDDKCSLLPQRLER